MRHFHAYSRAALAAALLGGACAASAADGPAADARRPLRVVATIFPAYDWVREIVGTNAADVQLTLLLDDGVELHSYQPTAADLKTVAGLRDAVEPIALQGQEGARRTLRPRVKRHTFRAVDAHPAQTECILW